MAGGEPFVVVLDSQLDGGTIHVDGVVIDNKDGTYTAEYVAPEPGDYVVSASLYGVSISGFPKELKFKPSMHLM